MGVRSVAFVDVKIALSLRIADPDKINALMVDTLMPFITYAINRSNQVEHKTEKNKIIAKVREKFLLSNIYWGTKKKD